MAGPPRAPPVVRVPEPDYDDEHGHGLSFSGTEVLHLAMAVVALSVAFSFTLCRSSSDPWAPDWEALPSAIPWAAAIVVTGFVLHELAHKIVAQQQSFWAEFRSSYAGLGLGLATSYFGMLLAAPGAVQIYGRATDRDAGVISIVGPLVNLGLGFVAYPLMFAKGVKVEVCSASNIFEIVVFINAFLAVFNMIPISPLDGSKIWRWSKVAYLSTAGLCLLLVYMYFTAPGVLQ